MVSYPAPTEILPIFNPSVWVNTLPGGGISQSVADTLYVSLATSQGVPSTKTYNTPQIFNNIASFATTSAVPGGQAQTIKSNTAPFVARLYNVNPSTSTDLALPQASGTIALLSDIPSAASFVTLAGPQTITGIKTFSAAPVISSISNTGVLTLPTSTDTLVGRDTTDTLTNKTLNLVAGAFGAPSLYFSTDTTSGLYRAAADQVGITISGTPRSIWSSTGQAITGGLSVSTTINAAAGLVTAPSIFFTNAGSSTGFYKPLSLHQIGVTCNASQVCIFTTSGLTVTGGISTTTTINSAAGTVGNPAVYFSTDTTSGLFRPAANQVAVACSGAQVANITSTGVAVTGSVSASTTVLSGAGTVGTPAHQFGGDTTSGLYRSAANEVAVSCSGTQRLKVSSTGTNITGISQTSIPMATMMTKSTTQVTANGVAVSVVSYDVSSNPSSYYTLNTTLGTITFTVSDAPCMMLVSGQIQFPTNAFTFLREIWIEDGSGLRWVDANRNGSNDAGDTSKSSIAGMRMITTNATYTLIMKIYQNTGASINSGGIVATNLTTFCVARIN